MSIVAAWASLVLVWSDFSSNDAERVADIGGVGIIATELSWAVSTLRTDCPSPSLWVISLTS